MSHDGRGRVPEKVTVKREHVSLHDYYTVPRLRDGLVGSLLSYSEEGGIRCLPTAPLRRCGGFASIASLKGATMAHRSQGRLFYCLRRVFSYRLIKLPPDP